MKIAFPTQKNIGIDSSVHSHFGSAPFFVVVDSDTGETETINNHDLNHTHGKCQPLAALGGKTVEAIATGGIGAGALQKLIAADVTAYRAIEGTVSENLALIKTGKLPEFSMEQTCAGHHHGECAHDIKDTIS